MFLSLPSGMDRLFKKHFDSFREKGLLPPELNGVNAKLFSDMELLNVWRNNRKGIRYEDADGNVISGAVDDVLVSGKKLIVLDYKTRGFALKETTHEMYAHKMNVYNYLFRKNGYETEDFYYLLFYHPIEMKNTGEVIFQSDLLKLPVDIKAAEKLIKDAIHVLQSPMPNSSEDCAFCVWFSTQKSI